MSVSADENKARVVDSGKLGGGILRFLEGGEDALLAFAISVIYNICVDNGGFCLFSVLLSGYLWLLMGIA